MHRVNEVWLNHGIVGMLHRIGCVDNIHLQKEETDNRQSKNLQFPCRSGFRETCTVSLTTAESYLNLEVVADVATVELRAD